MAALSIYLILYLRVYICFARCLNYKDETFLLLNIFGLTFVNFGVKGNDQRKKKIKNIRLDYMYIFIRVKNIYKSLKYCYLSQIFLYTYFQLPLLI